jgi:DNA-binding response OmpR family regulator
MRLLLADDNEMNVELATAALDRHEITVTRDGLSALKTALTGRFDLVILDVHMPGLRGDQVCRRLREAGVTTPIIALTASAMPSEIVLGRASGFDEYLTKPIRPDALVAAVERYSA